jgi:hypothetical protein
MVLGWPAPNREWSISELEVPQDCILGNFQPSLRDYSLAHANPGLTPDFLYAALHKSAYAAFFTESRNEAL